MLRVTLCVVAVLCCLAPAALAEARVETVWVEAEHLHGVHGYCWPLGRPNMRKTNGHWALSGPGWAAEWTQGGESGFLTISTAADDDKAIATTEVEIPVTGHYFVWVRYGDWREKTERFQIRIAQRGAPAWTGRFGERSALDEDNVMKLYWGWAFAWDGREVDLKKGVATLSLVSTTKDPEPRQVDVIVLTTDGQYRPRVKERPRNYAWEVLARWRQCVPADLEPLARRKPSFELPARWRVRTFKDKGFLYLWNVGSAAQVPPWLSDKPDRVRVPYLVGDEKTRQEFEKKYAGKSEGIPIFSDPRIVPTFHGPGAAAFATDPKTGALLETGQRLTRWLDAHPDRLWATMMNYAPDRAIGPEGIRAFRKYRDRYVGAISGESLGYFYPDAKALRAATAQARTRREVVRAFEPVTLAANTAKYRAFYGKDLESLYSNPYEDVIPCLSVGNITFAPLISKWGARTIGYESAAITSSVLGMRWAFMRGIARQGGNLTATYRSCNFGDSATIFSNTGSYHTPQNILDNYYSVYSGAGMTWYKMDIWYQYMAGSSMFYHEQGFDEFWRPGGTSAAGIHPVQLSPKGKLVDRFLRVTAAEPDRGSPFTPVAFLVDYTHGWEPSANWPNSFMNWHQHADRLLYGDHEKMLQEYFWTAYYPIGPMSEAPITATNEVDLPGVFGDIFDVICAYPDVARWTTIDTYPVVIAAGDIELTAAEGRRLAGYVDAGGTLLVADAQLTGPGAALLGLPPSGEPVEADAYRWMGGPALEPSARFRYRPITPPAGARVVAATADGKPFCIAVDRGAGRLVYLSVPRGLCIGRQIMPVVPRLFAHLSRGLMPVEVEGEVEWLVNRSARGWLLTLLNPAGQAKPQQGITPTDYRENRAVLIRTHVPVRSARDRLRPDAVLAVENGTVRCEVTAGGVRIIELQ